ncbi:hypothetical protein [Variovorax sp. N23]|uniref:hypothetical protein n=1 Tax=Variovorax sp. N23 TaxID=2980555 RepID=UPI0021C8D4C4|nr:hypothetical protein [Variovorax sp. N23]MCU4119324.1 hypothetical protein [Variovorax sp. N23]
MSIDQDLAHARSRVQHWQQVASRLADKKCAEVGHKRGARAWPGVWYCICCGGQFQGGEFVRGKQSVAVVGDRRTGEMRMVPVVAVDLDTEPQP